MTRRRSTKIKTCRLAGTCGSEQQRGADADDKHQDQRREAVTTTGTRFALDPPCCGQHSVRSQLYAGARHRYGLVCQASTKYSSLMPPQTR
jgi:hypothetical protein